MQTLKPVKSKIETTYQTSSFMRKPRLINALLSYKIGKTKKWLIKNVTLHK